MIKTKKFSALFLSLLFSLLCSPPLSHGAFGVAYTPQFFRWDLAPVRERADNDRALNAYSFELNDNVQMSHGLSFYWGRKDQYRAGFTLAGGYSRTQSDPVTFNISDSSSRVMSTIDSVLTLWTVHGYAGFLVDKIFMTGPFKFYAGGMVGAGALVLIRDPKEGSGESAFSSDGSNPPHLDDSTHNRSDVAVAPMTVLDVHVGATWTVASWFHFGTEVGSLFFYSNESFSSDSKSFFTANPGVKIKFAFGNLG